MTPQEAIDLLVLRLDQTANNDLGVVSLSLKEAMSLCQCLMSLRDAQKELGVACAAISDLKEEVNGTRPTSYCFASQKNILRFLGEQTREVTFTELRHGLLRKGFELYPTDFDPYEPRLNGNLGQVIAQGLVEVWNDKRDRRWYFRISPRCPRELLV